MTDLTDALREVQAQSELTPLEFDTLVQLCMKRAGQANEYRHSDETWMVPPTSQMSAWCNQAEFARILGMPSVNLRQWHLRKKLPEPDERVSGRPVWSRKTVQRFCNDLQLLAQES